MPQNAIAQIGHNSVAIDTIMRRPPGRSSVHWSRVRHVTGTAVIGPEVGRWMGAFVYQEEGHSPKIRLCGFELPRLEQCYNDALTEAVVPTKL